VTYGDTVRAKGMYPKAANALSNNRSPPLPTLLSMYLPVNLYERVRSPANIVAAPKKPDIEAPIM